MHKPSQNELGTMGTTGDNGCPQLKPLGNKGFLALGDKVATFPRIKKAASTGFLKIGDNATNGYKGLIHFNLNNTMVNRSNRKLIKKDISNVSRFEKLLTKTTSKPRLSPKSNWVKPSSKPTSHHIANHTNAEKWPLCPQPTSNPCAATVSAGDSEISRWPQCPHPHRDKIDDDFDVMVRDMAVRTTEQVRW